MPEAVETGPGGVSRIDVKLTRAMAPLGIEIRKTWTRPLVAVRDRDGRVVRQSEAEVDLSGLRTALDKLVR